MSDALHIYTCAAVNYLPKVRILCKSIRQHHPEAVIHLALADERPAWLKAGGEPFDASRWWTSKLSIDQVTHEYLGLVDVLLGFRMGN